MGDTCCSKLALNIEHLLFEFKDHISFERTKELLNAAEHFREIKTPLNADLIRHGLKLDFNPEGGFFSRFAISDQLSVIFYLLGSKETSAWHRLKNTEEEWRLISGHPLKLSWINNKSGKYEEKCLIFEKSEFFASENPGVWFGAFVEENYSLVICVCRPPFEDSNWELISESELERVTKENPDKIKEIQKYASKN